MHLFGKNRPALLLAFLLWGCAAAPDRPPEIHYGQDECANCRMQVGDERFAAARVANGTTSFFDDLGELFEFRTKNPASDGGERIWVHDFDTKAWLDARQAHYLRASSLHTPMGYGLAAFGEQSRASQALATHPGTLLTFDQAAQSDLRPTASTPKTEQALNKENRKNETENNHLPGPVGPGVLGGSCCDGPCHSCRPSPRP